MIRSFQPQKSVPPNALRSFGFVVGVGFLLVALVPVARGHAPRWWALAVAALLAISGALIPRALQVPYRLWMAAGAMLGWINSRVILGLVYFAVFTPIAALRRWQGTDPLGLRANADSASYRRPRTAREPNHMTHQY